MGRVRPLVASSDLAVVVLVALKVEGRNSSTTVARPEGHVLFSMTESRLRVRNRILGGTEEPKSRNMKLLERERSIVAILK